jgi:hypothetical protein
MSAKVNTKEKAISKFEKVVKALVNTPPITNKELIKKTGKK